MCSQMKISRGWENWNEKKILKILEIIVYSLNYILISYALSNIAMAMKRSPGFILFFASDIFELHPYVPEALAMGHITGLQENWSSDSCYIWRERNEKICTGFFTIR